MSDSLQPAAISTTAKTTKPVRGTSGFTSAMHRALSLAEDAQAAGEVPVGAVVLDAAGEIIGEGRNRRETSGDPLSHAEVEALRQAAVSHCAASADTCGTGTTASWNLSDCTLVVTLEPCPMCAGAALQAHIGRIVFGAWDEKLGACGSVWDIPRDPHIGSRPQVFGGVCESECAAVLQDFFSARRRVTS